MNREDIPEERDRIRSIVDSAHTVLRRDANGRPCVFYDCYVDGKRYCDSISKLIGTSHTDALGDLVEARERVINRVTENICRQMYPNWDSLQSLEWSARNTTYLAAESPTAKPTRRPRDPRA